MNYDPNFGARTYEEEFATVRGMNEFIAKVFGWMFAGLAVTSGVAYYVAGNIDFLYFIYSNPFVLYGLLIGELILVSVLSARITRLRYGTAVTMFLIYAALNGLTLSSLLIIYTQESVAGAFAITAVTFGVMSLYGYVTKADLTRTGSILFMGLIGILVLSLVNLFLASSGMAWFISLLSLFVFLGLTAYDMQKLKAYYFGTQGSAELRSNLGIIGALNLYLDFVNLFLTMLRFFGRRKN